MQPFANTLVSMKLTGAQIKGVLEEQWQPTGATRPFLKLGVSAGFTYTYDPTVTTPGSRITADVARRCRRSTPPRPTRSG